MPKLEKPAVVENKVVNSFKDETKVIANSEIKKTQEKVDIRDKRDTHSSSKEFDKQTVSAEEVMKNSFDTIDFKALTDVPEVYKKDKEKLFDTLEFGEAVDIKKQKLK